MPYQDFLDKVIVPEISNSDIRGEGAINSNPGNDLQYPADLFDASKGDNVPFIFFVVRDPQARGAEPKSFITMYMPAQIRVNYGARWETLELSLVRGAKALSGAYGGAQNIYNNPNLSNIAGKLLSVGAAVGNSNSLGQQIQVARGKTVNPHEVLMFRNVSFRSFGFEFQLMARNEKESDEIQKIIQAFKMAMHPGLDSGSTDTSSGFFWTYPENFDIFLFTPSADKMFRIDTCVLEDMDVDYAGSGIPSFFKSNGAPVDIRMALKFKELSVLTKEKVKKGF